MTIYDQKEIIENILIDLHITKRKITDNVKDLASYIDPEFYDTSYEDDKAISNRIQKRVNFFIDSIIEEMKNRLENSENINFKVSKDGLDDFEAIAYVYGSLNKKDETKKPLVFKKSHINSFIEDKNSFFIIVDLLKGSKLLQWKV